MSDVRSCPACGSAEEPERLVLTEMVFGLGETFPYARCPGCASLFIEQVPENLGEYYSAEKYYSFDLDPQAAMGRPGVSQAVRVLGRSVIFGHNVLAGAVQRAVRARRVRNTLNLFDKVRIAGLRKGKQSRILDIGSGSGALVYALSLTGVAEVTGVDPFHAEDRVFDTGARVLKRELRDVEGEYDLVMMHHSLEHMPDPRETLLQVRRLLAPGGRAIVRIPTVSSWAYEHYGVNWMGLDPPRHLTLFSRLGMERLCADTGMLIERMHDEGRSVQFWGSEQNLAGVPLGAPTSYFVDPRKSPYTTAQIRGWERRAAELNSQGLADQVMWVLTAAQSAG
jgi:SAM-dependent methyltransferase